jgi:hypothetical protein
MVRLDLNFHTLAAFAALPGSETPQLPSPEIDVTIPPRPPELVRDYILHVGGDPDAYGERVPAYPPFMTQPCLVSLGITVLPHELGRRSWTLKRPEAYFDSKNCAVSTATLAAFGATTGPFLGGPDTLDQQDDRRQIEGRQD